MKREDILEIVREAYERGQSDLMESCKEASVKAIELAVLAEREACAKVCEDAPEPDGRDLADRIRARGETK